MKLASSSPTPRSFSCTARLTLRQHRCGLQESRATCDIAIDLMQPASTSLLPVPRGQTAV